MNHGWLQGLWILGSHQPHSACQYIHFSGDVVLDSQKVQNPFKPLQSLKIIGWIIAKPSYSSKVLKKTKSLAPFGVRLLLVFESPRHALSPHHLLLPLQNRPSCATSFTLYKQD